VGLLEPADLSVLDVENLRLHYARTLEHWLARFEAHRDDIAKQLGERFVRMWHLYLAGSVAGFRTGTLQLFQALFARGGSYSIPWTREDLCRGSAAPRACPSSASWGRAGSATMRWLRPSAAGSPSRGSISSPAAVVV